MRKASIDGGAAYCPSCLVDGEFDELGTPTTVSISVEALKSPVPSTVDENSIRVIGWECYRHSLKLVADHRELVEEFGFPGTGFVAPQVETDTGTVCLAVPYDEMGLSDPQER